MTRTFVVGDPTPEHARLIAEPEQLVREALDHAIGSVHLGVTGRTLYDAAPRVWREPGSAMRSCPASPKRNVQ